MSETHIVSALRAKRAEVSGHVHDLEKRAKAWRARLAHIDATINIFSPETDPHAMPPKKPYRRSRYFQRASSPGWCWTDSERPPVPSQPRILQPAYWR
jgi:hypothetical protein